MPSDDIKAVREMIAAQPPRNEMTVPERRTSMDGWDDVHPVPDGVQVAAARVADVPVEWIGAPNAREDRLLLYLHGGGYVIGSPSSHRHFVAKLSEETELQALLVDYRLAPENPFPAAVEDATAVYASLVTHGYEPKDIVVVGDSAARSLSVLSAVNLFAGLEMAGDLVIGAEPADFTYFYESTAPPPPELLPPPPGGCRNPCSLRRCASLSPFPP